MNQEFLGRRPYANVNTFVFVAFTWDGKESQNYLLGSLWCNRCPANQFERIVWCTFPFSSPAVLPLSQGIEQEEPSSHRKVNGSSFSKGNCLRFFCLFFRLGLSCFTLVQLQLQIQIQLEPKLPRLLSGMDVPCADLLSNILTLSWCSWPFLISCSACEL